LIPNEIWFLLCLQLFINELSQIITTKLFKLSENEFKQLKESKKSFEKLTHDLDNSFQKNADSAKSKPNLCDENEKNLCGIRKVYGHSALEYLSQINKIYATRGHLMLTLVSLKPVFVNSFQGIS
jgi:hypothetical protein